MSSSVLVELLTEELPPKSLRQLGHVFAAEVAAGLATLHLRHPEGEWQPYATPRRLAVLIPGVKAKGDDRVMEVSGPSVKAPPEAVAGFARKQGVDARDLRQLETPKGPVWAATVRVKGAVLAEVLADVIAAAVKKLPISKVMRWGAGEAQFVRPVHGLVMMHGKKAIQGTVLGVKAGSRTRGHRFMSAGAIAIPLADQYETLLLKKGKVIADFQQRREEIKRQLKAQAKKQQARLDDYKPLLDEVTALVEYPEVYVGAFDREFLDVPQECLVLTMRQNQKYFPLFDGTGRLLPRFLIVSNMKVADPKHIIGGNERVVRPRLEDARFFYTQDRKTRLEERVPLLAKVVYHNKLGTQLERAQRVRLLAGQIARVLGADVLQVERAAELAKADLLTGMVGEFPELQGTMGRYYALHDGEPAAVADAIESHYRPRFAGDRLPEGAVACAVALADKLDAIAGLFSIGQQPTGDKDPFGLRRAALGVVRILVENKLHLSLKELAKAAVEPFGKKADSELVQFVYDRFSGYLKELGYTTLQIESVLSKEPVNLGVVLRQLDAVKAFQSLPEAESLAAANKRVLNIISKNEAIRHKFIEPKRELMVEPAELALMDAVEELSPISRRHYENGEFEKSMTVLAAIRPAVDEFFEKVMVMVDDEGLRNNRAALLQKLGLVMNQVANISKLSA